MRKKNSKLVSYEIITDLRDIELDYYFVFDFESTNSGSEYAAYEWYRDEVKPTLLAVTTAPDKNYILPIHERYGIPTWTKFNQLKDIIEDPSYRSVAHNIKFDMHLARKLCGHIDVKSSTCYDTQAIGHLLFSLRKKSLKEWTSFLFPKLSGYESEVDFEGPFDQLADYAVIDSYVTYHLLEFLANHLAEDEAALHHVVYYLMPGIFSLYKAEANGAYIDEHNLLRWINKAEKYLYEKNRTMQKLPSIKRYIFETNKEEKSKEIERIKIKLEEYEEKGKAHYKKYQSYLDQIKDIRAGKLVLYDSMNFASPKQVDDFLYTSKGLGLKGYGTSVTLLKKINHPFVEHLLDYRSIAKLHSTYFKGIQYGLHNGSLHSSFKIDGTSTGRLSSSDPNLQNIPKHIKREDQKEFVKGVRELFIAPEGYKMVQFDYSQAELRMAANFSRDETMIDAYLDGIDLHTRTGAALANMEYEEFIDSDLFKLYRQLAKSINFGFLYGMMPETYQANLFSDFGEVISIEEAQQRRNLFFGTYKRLKAWHYDSIRLAKRKGYAQTLFGRKLKLLNINSHLFWKRSQDERVAINMPVQGTVGEMTVWAGAFACMDTAPGTQYVLNVHDSINFYIRDEYLEEEIARIKDIAENLPIEEYFGVDPGPVPMKIDVEVGTNWSNLKKYTS